MYVKQSEQSEDKVLVHNTTTVKQSDNKVLVHNTTTPTFPLKDAYRSFVTRTCVLQLAATIKTAEKGHSNGD